MTLRLVPCSACSRHIRVDSQQCPFCFTSTVVASEPPRARPSGRLSSLAVMTFRAATLGAAITACGGEANEPVGHGGATGTGGAAGSTASGGASDVGSGGNTSTSSGGTIEVGTGGTLDGTGGGPVPIYRATPRG